MKKMKKIFAMLLAFTMVLGMTMTASAEKTKPVAENTATAVVTNIEKDATVTAYQIIKGDYGTNGFLGYKEVDGVDLFESTYLSKEADLPTSEEITDIARKINAGTLSGLTKVNLVEQDAAEGEALTSYKANLKAGYWVVLVRGTVKVYNPMLVGVYYDTDRSGDDNVLETDGELSAAEKWTLVTNGAYAKSTEPTIEKTANVQTQNVGKTVDFEITTTIPDYSTEYTSAKFEIKDTLTNLKLAKNPEDSTKPIVKVVVDETDVTTNTTVCKITGNTEDSTTFTVAFESAWLLERTKEDNKETDIAANAGKSVKVTYTAVVTDGAVNQTEASNNAKLTYTNTPTAGEGYDEDIEKVYTFDIDGELTNNILKKVKEGTVANTTEALPGATFTMYTAMKELGAANDVVYSNTDSTDDLVNTGEEDAGTVVSDTNGLLHIAGLAAGTYYIKETIAPAGYSLNDTIYKIVITPTFSTENVEELASWTIVVTPYTKNNGGQYVEQAADAKTSKFDVNQKTVEENKVITVKEDIGFSQELTQIMNIQLIALPSTGGIGTTIFTVAGCGIMIAAAFFFFASRKKEN